MERKSRNEKNMIENMIENIKARFNCKKFNIWTEKEDNKRNRDSFFGGDYIYNGVIYYGNPFMIFFRSSQNRWYKENSNY